ncbi:MAG: hypothetical protein NT133_01960 [Alphaproteobacteria bacterium]|nr:hypothetical protein [Alphaproteobacteria bacterium]
MSTITTNQTVGLYLTSPAFTNPVAINAGVSITGLANSYGVYAPSGSWTITNAGTVAPGGAFNGTPFSGGGIYLSAGTVTNLASGLISAQTALPSGRNAVYIGGAGGSVSNAGHINGGVDLIGAGVVTNLAGGTITSRGDTEAAFGVRFGGGGTLVNAGLVDAQYFGLAGATAGATVINQAGGTITAQYVGVEFGLAGSSGTGVRSVTNQAGGQIFAHTGVVITSQTGTVVNAGTIRGLLDGTVTYNNALQHFGDGITLAAGGTVTNLAGGTISGARYGIDIQGGTATVSAAGVISGATTAVRLAAGQADRLVVNPGVVFNGIVDGGNASNSAAVSTLEFAAGGSGTLSGIGTQVVNFGLLQFDAGARWAISGTAPALAGPISGFAVGDTITLTGLATADWGYNTGMLTLVGAPAPTTIGLSGSFTSDMLRVKVSSGNTVISLRPAGVTVQGAAGDAVEVEFEDDDEVEHAFAAFASVNDAIAAGSTIPFNAAGGTPPSVPGGKSGALLTHSGGSFVVPLGYTTFASDSPTPVTVSGGALNGQAVISGSGGLAYNAGAGSGTVFAAGGNNLISVYPGAGNHSIEAGPGNDTIVILGGDDTVNAGGGTNQILTGRGHDVVNSTGDDLIAAGDIGSATINAAANNPVAFFGPGSTVFNGGTGKATVVSTVGHATINGHGGTQIWLGSGDDVVNSTGADTIIGGSGMASVLASAGDSFVFAGTGSIDITGGSGATTVLGSAIGTATLHGGSGSLIALASNAMVYSGGSGAGTIAAFGGSVTVNGGAGSGVYLGGPAGHNEIHGGAGQSIILGGGDGDVLTAGTGAGDVIQAGSGAETINAAGTPGAHKLYAGTGSDVILTGSGNTNVLMSTGAATIIAGSGLDLFAFTAGNHPNVTIQNFSAASDYLSFIGFPGTEKADALAGAITSGGSETLILSDGTHITLQGFTGLQAANFL